MGALRWKREVTRQRRETHVVHQRHALARDTGHLARLGHAHRLQDDGVPVQVLELQSSNRPRIRRRGGGGG